MELEGRGQEAVEGPIFFDIFDLRPLRMDNRDNRKFRKILCIWHLWTYIHRRGHEAAGAKEMSKQSQMSQRSQVYKVCQESQMFQRSQVYKVSQECQMPWCLEYLISHKCIRHFTRFGCLRCLRKLRVLKSLRCYRHVDLWDTWNLSCLKFLRHLIHLRPLKHLRHVRHLKRLRPLRFLWDMRPLRQKAIHWICMQKTSLYRYTTKGKITDDRSFSMVLKITWLWLVIFLSLFWLAVAFGLNTTANQKTVKAMRSSGPYLAFVKVPNDHKNFVLVGSSWAQ